MDPLTSNPCSSRVNCVECRLQWALYQVLGILENKDGISSFTELVLEEDWSMSN